MIYVTRKFNTVSRVSTTSGRILCHSNSVPISTYFFMFHFSAVLPHPYAFLIYITLAVSHIKYITLAVSHIKYSLTNRPKLSICVGDKSHFLCRLLHKSLVS